MPPEDPDQRATTRRPLPQAILFERTAQGSRRRRRRLRRGLGRDISPAGARFWSRCFLAQGEILRLFLELERPRTRIPVVSEVRWSRPVSGGFEVGLRFLA